MLIGLCGFIGSGKGTVGDILRHIGFTAHSFAGPLKDATSAIFGWERSLLEGDTKVSREFREMPDIFWSNIIGRDFTPREALQLLGTECTRNIIHQDIWINSLQTRLKGNCVITDVRFQNEIDFVHKNCGIIVAVERGPRPNWWDDAKKYNLGDMNSSISIWNIHPSEYSWVSDKIDYFIKNDGTIEDLKYKVIDILYNSFDKKLIDELLNNGELYETKQ